MFYYHRYLVPPLRTKFLAKWEFRFWVFDSIAVLLFVNMKVDTGEIPINTKENIRKKIQLTILILKWGPYLFGCTPQRFFSDKIREIEFDRIANSHLILKKDRFISRPMTEPSFNFN